MLAAPAHSVCLHGYLNVVLFRLQGRGFEFSFKYTFAKYTVLISQNGTDFSSVAGLR